MKITGHSTREMFDRYNLVSEEQADLAVQHLSEFLKEEAKKIGRE